MNKHSKFFGAPICNVQKKIGEKLAAYAKSGSTDKFKELDDVATTYEQNKARRSAITILSWIFNSYLVLLPIGSAVWVFMYLIDPKLLEARPLFSYLLERGWLILLGFLGSEIKTFVKSTKSPPDLQITGSPEEH